LCPVDVATRTAVDVATRTEYYTPSYVNETDVLREATMIELSNRRRAGVYGESEREKCLNAILDDWALCEKVKQALSEAGAFRCDEQSQAECEGQAPRGYWIQTHHIPDDSSQDY